MDEKNEQQESLSEEQLDLNELEQSRLALLNKLGVAGENPIENENGNDPNHASVSKDTETSAVDDVDSDEHWDEDVQAPPTNEKTTVDGDNEKNDLNDKRETNLPARKNSKEIIAAPDCPDELIACDSPDELSLTEEKNELVDKRSENLPTRKNSKDVHIPADELIACDSPEEDELGLIEEKKVSDKADENLPARKNSKEIIVPRDELIACDSPEEDELGLIEEKSEDKDQDNEEGSIIEIEVVEKGSSRRSKGKHRHRKHKRGKKEKEAVKLPETNKSNGTQEEEPEEGEVLEDSSSEGQQSPQPSEHSLHEISSGDDFEEMIIDEPTPRRGSSEYSHGSRKSDSRDKSSKKHKRSSKEKHRRGHGHERHRHPNERERRHSTKSPSRQSLRSSDGSGSFNQESRSSYDYHDHDDVEIISSSPLRDPRRSYSSDVYTKEPYQSAPPYSSSYSSNSNPDKLPDPRVRKFEHHVSPVADRRPPPASYDSYGERNTNRASTSSAAYNKPDFRLFDGNTANKLMQFANYGNRNNNAPVTPAPVDDDDDENWDAPAPPKKPNIVETKHEPPSKQWEKKPIDPWDVPENFNKPKINRSMSAKTWGSNDKSWGAPGANDRVARNRSQSTTENFAGAPLSDEDWDTPNIPAVASTPAPAPAPARGWSSEARKPPQNTGYESDENWDVPDLTQKPLAPPSQNRISQPPPLPRNPAPSQPPYHHNQQRQGGGKSWGANVDVRRNPPQNTGYESDENWDEPAPVKKPLPPPPQINKSQHAEPLLPAAKPHHHHHNQQHQQQQPPVPLLTPLKPHHHHQQQAAAAPPLMDLHVNPPVPSPTIKPDLISPRHPQLRNVYENPKHQIVSWTDFKDTIKKLLMSWYEFDIVSIASLSRSTADFDTLTLHPNLLRYTFERAHAHFFDHAPLLTSCFKVIDTDHHSYRNAQLQNGQGLQKFSSKVLELNISTELQEYIRNVKMHSYPTSIDERRKPPALTSSSSSSPSYLPPFICWTTVNGGYYESTVEQVLKSKQTSLQLLLCESIVEAMDEIETLEENADDEAEDDDEIDEEKEKLKKKNKEILLSKKYLYYPTTSKSSSASSSAAETESERLRLLTIESSIHATPWNLINCIFPYSIFILFMNSINRRQKAAYIKNESDICHEITKFRYIEYVHQTTKDHKQFLLCLVSAYGVDAVVYPSKIFEYLKIRKLLKWFDNLYLHQGLMKGPVLPLPESLAKSKMELQPLIPGLKTKDHQINQLSNQPPLPPPVGTHPSQQPHLPPLPPMPPLPPPTPVSGSPPSAFRLETNIIGNPFATSLVNRPSASTSALNHNQAQLPEPPMIPPPLPEDADPTSHLEIPFQAWKLVYDKALAEKEAENNANIKGGRHRSNSSSTVPKLPDSEYESIYTDYLNFVRMNYDGFLNSLTICFPKLLPPSVIHNLIRFNPMVAEEDEIPMEEESVVEPPVSLPPIVEPKNEFRHFKQENNLPHDNYGHGKYENHNNNNPSRSRNTRNHEAVKVKVETQQHDYGYDNEYDQVDHHHGFTTNNVSSINESTIIAESPTTAAAPAVLDFVDYEAFRRPRKRNHSGTPSNISAHSNSISSDPANETGSHSGSTSSKKKGPPVAPPPPKITLG